MTEQSNCPICHQQAKRYGYSREGVGGVGWSYECSRCGKLALTWELDTELRDAPGRDSWWHRLSAWTREQSDRDRLPTILKGPIPDLVDRLPDQSLQDRMDLLLRVLEQRTEHYGRKVVFDPAEVAPLVWARNREEVCFLLKGLEDADRVDAGQKAQEVEERKKASLTIKGCLRLEALNESVTMNKRVFVAMWFADSTRPAFDDGLSVAISRAGYEPFVVSREPDEGERIDAKIMVDIRRSRALVADVTGQRPNVYYEAGFAEGLGKPVIWTAHRSEMKVTRKKKGLPFDTRQFLHVIWDTPADLAAQLQPVIENRLALRHVSV